MYGLRQRAVRTMSTIVLGTTPMLLHGQTPRLTIEQLHHRAWTAREGAPSSVNAIAQTPDGYLWLATLSGLFRFDGISFERIESDTNSRSRATAINSLLALPDGSLWIGYTTGGVVRIRREGLTRFENDQEFPKGTVNSLARDSLGRIWATTTRGVARFDGERWELVGPESGYPGDGAASVFVDRRGTVWVAGRSGVFSLARGGGVFARRAAALAAAPAGAMTGGIAEAPDGSVWAASDRGVVQLTDTAGKPPERPDRPYGGRDWCSLVIDNESNAWGLCIPGRLVRVRLPRATDRDRDPDPRSTEEIPLTREREMSGPMTVCGFIDREGNLWIGTVAGIDRFRVPKAAAVQFPVPMTQPAIVAEDGGRVWAADNTTSSQYETDGATLRPRNIYPGAVTGLYRDGSGVEWIGGVEGVWTFDGHTGTKARLPRFVSAGYMRAMMHGSNDDLWLSMGLHGVFRRRRGAWERFDPVKDLLEAMAIVVDTSNAVWLGYMHSFVLRVVGDSVQTFSVANGVRVGDVSALHSRGNRVWVGGALGIMVFQDEKPLPFGVASGELRGVSGIVETAEGDLWLNGSDGVTHVPGPEVRRALRDTTYRARDEKLDFLDGVGGPAPTMAASPTVIEGTDGRLWFASNNGLSWLDPRHIRRNVLPPPVHVTRVIAGGQRYRASGRDTLPPRTSPIQISYTALSLGMPERIRFRYRLIGNDTAWQEAGSRREATYTNLGPGAYTFQVIAANEDGVWNDVGASVDFEVRPTFAQTNAFLFLCAVSFAGVVWGIAMWRQRRVAATLRARFDATLAERTRIAQELHDTLIQGFTGVTLQVHAAQGMLKARPDEASDILSRAIAGAQVNLREMRQMVWEMRAPELETADLADAVSQAAREAIGDRTVSFQLTVAGERRRLPHVVELTALRIAREAAINAVRHAAPQTITIGFEFDRSELKMSVCDDGRGFNSLDLDGARAVGHWGIVSMRERATTVGGSLNIEAMEPAGTRISLVLPIRESAAVRQTM
jgi:signal transduction histidine kinase/ligand-binding sensor domain-containing protein